LDEPKVRLYEDFVRISKLITIKAYSSKWDNFTKALQAKVTQYYTQIQDLQSQLDEWMGPLDAFEEEEHEDDLGGANLALIRTITPNLR